MDQTPLLQKRLPHHSLPISRRLWGGLLTWTRATTGKAYLSSVISRRPIWKYVIPLASIYTALLGGTSLVASGNHTPWYCDVIYVSINCLATTVYSTLEVVQSPALGFAAGCWQTLLSCALLGMHSTCLALLGACCFAMALTLPQVPENEQKNFQFTLFVVVSFYGTFEFCIATLLERLQQQVDINTLLLDRATDGFCCVDAISGAVLSASPKMSRTFGDIMDRTDLKITDFVGAADKAGVAALLSEDKQEHSNSELITCYRWHGQVPSEAFDGLVCWYHTEGDQVHFFWRVVGEVREYSSEDAPGATQPDLSIAGKAWNSQVLATPGPAGDMDELASELSFAVSATTMTTLNKSMMSTQSQRNAHRLFPAQCQSAATQTDESIASRQKPPLPIRGRAATRTHSSRGSRSQQRGQDSPARSFEASLSISCLKSTTTYIKIHSVLRLLRQWNIQLPEPCCCILHGHISECTAILKKLKRMPCERRNDFVDKMGEEQCTRCGMVNFIPDSDQEDDETCMWCSDHRVDQILQFESDLAMKVNRREASRSPSRSPRSRLDDVESDAESQPDSCTKTSL
eukprot:TRINITY_DN9078_c1_g1_i1.p1 TRINITY_DN9078_c1_g1~~TRINITY_DN9078_c1_g1_i1.p1  ORF type:complete len:574 (-),score=43.02 TRINITY_DN9078_c1_g1_i1:36-1757(-)